MKIANGGVFKQYKYEDWGNYDSEITCGGHYGSSALSVEMFDDINCTTNEVLSTDKGDTIKNLNYNIFEWNKVKYFENSAFIIDKPGAVAYALNVERKSYQPILSTTIASDFETESKL